MALKITILLFILNLAGCSLMPHVLYKVDVQQGNVVTDEMLETLKQGMTKSQVRFVLGSPLVVDAFRDNRWDYLYIQREKDVLIEQKRLTVYFENDRLIQFENEQLYSLNSTQPKSVGTLVQSTPKRQKIDQPEPGIAVNRPSLDRTVIQPKQEEVTDQPKPTVVVDQPKPDSQIDQPEPGIAVNRPSLDETVIQPKQEEAADQSEPTVVVEQPKPDAQIDQPEPGIAVNRPSLDETVIQPKQKEAADQPEPAVVVDQPKPDSQIVILEADRIEGIYEDEMEAIGDAKVCYGDMTLTADRMKYFPQTKDTEVIDNVWLDRKSDFIEGDYLKYNLDTHTGFLTEPRYTMTNGDGRGSGEKLLFEGKNNFRLKKGNYTTCPAEEEDWYIRASDLEIDSEKEEGVARNVTVVFKKVPILYTPWLDFSYSGKRKTGFLAPVVGHTKRSGADLAIPFYINIAPNIDATISPRVMSKRGFMLGNELRYIGYGVNGRLQGDILPDDFDTGKTRYGVSLYHNQYLGNGWSGRLDYNRVSDNRFLRDLSNTLSQTSRTNLLQQASLNYHGDLGLDGTLNLSAVAQRFQTLQDPFLAQNLNLLIISPYRRLPQLTMNATKRNVAGMDFGLNATWTHFSHPDANRIDGKRLTLFPTISRPMRNSFGFITPKLGLHYTHYALSQAVGNEGSNPDRLVPIVSLDSGVIFDRNITIGGNNYIQTLEPRAFYVYAPFKNQSFLPNFDSAESDFSFAQMLTENRFSGNDRINDANQVTLALTTKLLEPSTGIERLRAAVGQQFRFSDRRVILDSSQVTSRRADFIAALSGRITREISTDVNIQIDQQSLRTEKIRAGISYRPEAGKVINLGYRFTRDVRESIDVQPNQLNTAIKQVDTSFQWPLFSNWHTVARVNYSLRDDRLLAGLAGVEYISCCYKFRVVFQQLTTATRRTTTAVFVQLELNELMNIGSNPLRVLQQSIPGYTGIY